MKLFLHINPNTIAESFLNPSPKMQLSEIDVISDSIAVNVGKEVKVPKDVLASFKIKDSLNQDIWNKDELNPKVRAKLIQVANDFYIDLNLPKDIPIKDIIFTGSLANFNWSKYSDIDLHIVLDFKSFDAESSFIEEFFYAQKTLWNQEHEINEFGYPIELYVQDVNAKLVASAVFSILNNKWLIKPEHESFKLDISEIKDRVSNLITTLKDIQYDYKDKEYKMVVNKAEKLKNRITNMRTAGLEKGGEFSIENLVFKVLRRTSYMDLLNSIKIKAYDKLMSVAETLSEANMWVKGGVLLIKGVPLEDNQQRLYVTVINDLSLLNRIRNDKSKGISAKMITLGNQVYRIALVDGKLKANGVSWSSKDAQAKILGLQGMAVVLNNNKTPLWWKTLEVDNIPQVVNSLSTEISSIPGIKWLG